MIGGGDHLYLKCWVPVEGLYTYTSAGTCSLLTHCVSLSLGINGYNTHTHANKISN